jgi:hypothetical protein
MLRNNIDGKLHSPTKLPSVIPTPLPLCLSSGMDQMQNSVDTTKKTSIHLPPSPKVIDENRSFNQTEHLNIQPSRRIQQANAMFDPNNASPASEFMNVLKLRMSVYYEQDNMFV